MDRRRFVPSSEGLEIRNLLSTATAAAPAAAAVSGQATTSLTSNQPNVAQTIETKFQRIENLPFFLGRLTKDNVVPEAAVSEIQDALRANVAQLHQSSSTVVRKFNVDLRRVLTNENIQPTDAENLRNDVNAVLSVAGASASSRAQLRDGLDQLTQFDSHQRNSAIVTANHYATILQIALETGRPLVAPAKPRLVALHRTTSKGVDTTRDPRPEFTGQYTEAAQVQIVEAGTNRVLGTSGLIDKTNVYTVRTTDKLPDGTYTVRLRAIDGAYASDLSKAYTFTVKTPVVTGKVVSVAVTR